MGKNSYRHTGQVLWLRWPGVGVSHIDMHSDPTTWLQGRRTARSMVPFAEGVVPYSSMQMVQCWSSFDSTPRPTLGRRARNASAMVKAAGEGED